MKFGKKYSKDSRIQFACFSFHVSLLFYRLFVFQTGHRKVDPVVKILQCYRHLFQVNHKGQWYVHLGKCIGPKVYTASKHGVYSSCRCQLLPVSIEEELKLYVNICRLQMLYRPFRPYDHLVRFSQKYSQFHDNDNTYIFYAIIVNTTQQRMWSTKVTITEKFLYNLQKLFQK